MPLGAADAGAADPGAALAPGAPLAAGLLQAAPTSSSPIRAAARRRGWRRGLGRMALHPFGLGWSICRRYVPCPATGFPGSPGFDSCAIIRQPTRMGTSVGAWRSLVARIVRDDKVGGSNPLAPTKPTSSSSSSSENSDSVHNHPSPGSPDPQADQLEFNSIIRRPGTTIAERSVEPGWMTTAQYASHTGVTKAAVKLRLWRGTLPGRKVYYLKHCSG